MSGSKFEDISYEQWQKAAEAALRGKPLKDLSKFTEDGLEIPPLYKKGDYVNQAPLPQGAWQINQAINHPDIAKATAQIAEDLEQGVNGLSLYSNRATMALGYGLELNKQNIENLFQNTYLEMISLRLETGLDEYKVAELVKSHYVNTSKIGHLSLGVDPISKIAAYGEPDEALNAKNAVQKALSKLKATYILRADGRLIHNSGGTETLELSYIIGTAYTYLKWADEAKIDLHYAATKIELCISINQNQFRNIAKIRALRQLWADLLDGLGIQQSPAYIYAETSYRMLTKRDPWVNLLRSTIACFAAGVGGANQIGILPMSAAIGLAPSFDRRLARHIQTILIEECHLADVTDPSAGSAYIEHLTTDFSHISWERFQEVENEGGLIEAIYGRKFSMQLISMLAKREAKFAAHEQELTGTSNFQIPDEEIYQTLDVPKKYPDKHIFTNIWMPFEPASDSAQFERDFPPSKEEK